MSCVPKKKKKLESDRPPSIYLNAQLHDFFYKEVWSQMYKNALGFY